MTAKLGLELETYFPGNAPMGLHYYPIDNAKSSVFGVKVPMTKLATCLLM